MTKLRDDLYALVVRSMPIACVDLLVVDSSRRVLLLKRRNEPAQGQWWFPGGRVEFGERRRDAAVRKLRQECGLSGESTREIGTFDVFIETSRSERWHAITTVFEMHVGANDPVIIDDQSEAGLWSSVEEWLDSPLPDFVRRELTAMRGDLASR